MFTYITSRRKSANLELPSLEAMTTRLLSPCESFPDQVYQECRKILHEQYADWLG